MPTTSNFGWTTPADTDLVKDGAAAIRTLGNGVDTSFVDLKGGTTGQVLSKTSNTDLDFTWVTTDDANAIQNAIVDAKGDLIAASANDTPARLAVGNNGDTLLADSSQSTGLRWGDNLGYTAGKNKIINGDFRINQRQFTSITTTNTYSFDRFVSILGGDGTTTITPQTFTPGAAPVAGYEGVNFWRAVTAGYTNAASRTDLSQRVEDVRTLAGQTVTVSFYAKAASGTPKIAFEIAQEFGVSGSASVVTAGGSVTISTSWARYSKTINIPSVSGKTIGASSLLNVRIFVNAGSDLAARADSIGIQNNTFDIWGYQIESGSVATAFQTASGSIAGELALCQRYYVRFIGADGNDNLGTTGFGSATTQAVVPFVLPTQMRITPSAIESSTVEVTDLVNEFAITVTLGGNSTPFLGIANCAATGLTQFRPYFVRNDNNAAGYVAFTAEL